MKNAASILLLALCLASPAFAQSATTPAPMNDDQLAATLRDTRARAERGDADAQFKLGMAYEEGRGVTQDYAQAAAWYRKAADQGFTVAREIAHAYGNDHKQLIGGEILGLANDIARVLRVPFDKHRIAFLFNQDRIAFSEYLAACAKSRGLSGALIIDKDRNVLTRAGLHLPVPPADFLNETPESVPRMGFFENYVVAAIRLRGFDNTFLYVARLLDPRAVAQASRSATFPHPGQ